MIVVKYNGWENTADYNDTAEAFIEVQGIRTLLTCANDQRNGSNQFFVY
jgi:hypothetical protein